MFYRRRLTEIKNRVPIIIIWPDEEGTIYCRLERCIFFASIGKVEA